MKILLVGEYSKLHNSLKKGLVALGHEVTLVGTGDNFKQFPVDQSYAPKITYSNAVFRYANYVLHRWFKFSLEGLEKGWRFFFMLPQFKGYDHVQLINSDAIETLPVFGRYLLKKLFRQNKNASLLVCGDDTPVTQYLLKKELDYSVLTPYFEHPKLKHRFHHVLKYNQNRYRRLFDFVQQHSSCLITSDLDYHIPMTAMGYETQLIPNPVILPKNPAKPQPVTDKIQIFLGINRGSALKKGIPFFQKALKIIEERYADRITIQITENLPYHTYCQTRQQAHIVLDMVYAYDQGYNALEAMAQGKVVFTGAEHAFLKHYNVNENEVCINALPDVNDLVQKLSWLIDNPSKIKEIGRNAQDFIQREHNYKKIAQRYVEVWKKT